MKDHRRDFLKKALLASAGVATAPLIAAAHRTAEGQSGIQPSFKNAGKKAAKKVLKNWVWINPDQNKSTQEMDTTYSAYAKAGITGVFFENDSEKHFRSAKRQGLEAHRWMWTMNRGEKELLQAHSDWYAVSRTGKSCATQPPYVDYYRWLCPSKATTLEYLQKQVQDILSLDYVDGIHLDYVRYCDVILPVNLWSNYNLVQTKELPDYDFCYCDHCQESFTNWCGETLKDITFPEASLSWRQFRYNQITNIVNHLAEIAHGTNKKITAAVFPTPEVARRNVRQDWTYWNMDGVCPMIYHGFYKENTRWIGDAVAEGVHFLHGKMPLYAGLYLPDFKSSGDLKEGIRYALNNGAGGISFFGKVTDGDLACLQEVAGQFLAK